MATTTMSIQFDLAPREKLLWSGVPRQGIMLRPQDALMIPFSILWGGFAIFWEATVLSNPRGPAFFALWGIPFVCVGLYLIVGRFFYDAWRRSRTAYGVTTQRVLIATGGFAPGIKSFDLGTLPTMALDERPDGTGTITFGLTQPYQWRGVGAWSGAPQSPAFESIGGAKAVYDQILAARADVRPAPAA
jgi:hypothetical protein